jgi:hypothetical protein
VTSNSESTNLSVLLGNVIRTAAPPADQLSLRAEPADNRR